MKKLVLSALPLLLSSALSYAQPTPPVTNAHCAQVMALTSVYASQEHRESAYPSYVQLALDSARYAIDLNNGRPTTVSAQDVAPLTFFLATAEGKVVLDNCFDRGQQAFEALTVEEKTNVNRLVLLSLPSIGSLEQY